MTCLCLCSLDAAGIMVLCDLCSLDAAGIMAVCDLSLFVFSRCGGHHGSV